MNECWCPSSIGVPHTHGQLGCQDHKPRTFIPEDMPVELLDTSLLIGDSDDLPE